MGSSEIVAAIRAALELPAEHSDEKIPALVAQYAAALADLGREFDIEMATRRRCEARCLSMRAEIRYLEAEIVRLKMLVEARTWHA